MKNNAFEYKVPGKWILAGEHAVLRQSEALVFPLINKYLEFIYQPNKKNFDLIITGTYKSDLDLFIWSVIEKYLNLLNIKREQLTGSLEIKTEIQFGAGMGASATLAVGLSLFFSRLGYLEIDVFQFSKKIEDLFHGESSGVDVAVALNAVPLIYRRGQPIQLLKNYKLPLFCVSYSGIRGVTKDCVDKVKNLLLTDPEKYQLVDQRMISCVNQIKQSLTSGSYLDQNEWIMLIDKSQSCFTDWGLVPDEAEKHIQLLKKLGALSCKMTGSGGGGYILSLWPENYNFNLIPASFRSQLTEIESNS